MLASTEGILDEVFWLKLIAILCAWSVEYHTIRDPGLYLPCVDSAGYSMSSCPNQATKKIPRDIPLSVQLLAPKTKNPATSGFGTAQNQIPPSAHEQKLAIVTRIAPTSRLVTAPPHLSPKSSPWMSWAGMGGGKKRGGGGIPPVETHRPIPRLPHHHRR